MREGRDIVAVTAEPLVAAGRSVMIAIGIDRYRHWRALDNAVGDALGAAALFQRLGFEPVVPPLLDERATGEAIEALVTDELTGLGANDSLVIFFAGHGGTRTQRVGDRDVRTGYVIPVDAAEDPHRVSSWIELDPWLRRIAKLPPRHILVVLDACFSGMALSSAIKWGRDSGALPGLPFAAANLRPSRLVITSALDDERAMDSGPTPGHSLFTGCLIEALTGGLAPVGTRDGRHVTIGSELGRYIRHRVQTYEGRPGWQQTPDLGSFDFDERGEMLIPLLLGADLAALPGPPARGSADRIAPCPPAELVDAAAAIRPLALAQPATPLQVTGLAVSDVAAAHTATPTVGIAVEPAAERRLAGDTSAHAATVTAEIVVGAPAETAPPTQLALASTAAVATTASSETRPKVTSRSEVEGPPPMDLDPTKTGPAEPARSAVGAATLSITSIDDEPGVAVAGQVVGAAMPSLADPIEGEQVAAHRNSDDPPVADHALRAMPLLASANMASVVVERMPLQPSLRSRRLLRARRWGLAIGLVLLTVSSGFAMLTRRHPAEAIAPSPRAASAPLLAADVVGEGSTASTAVPPPPSTADPGQTSGDDAFQERSDSPPGPPAPPPIAISDAPAGSGMHSGGSVHAPAPAVHGEAAGGTPLAALGPTDSGGAALHPPSAAQDTAAAVPPRRASIRPLRQKTSPATAANTEGVARATPQRATADNDAGVAPTTPQRATADNGADIVPATPQHTAGNDAAVVTRTTSALAARPPALCDTEVATPRGATVIWDGGTATIPTHIQLPCGVEVTLTIRAPYREERVQRWIASPDRKVIRVALQKATLQVYVDSEPSGATVIVAKKPRGVTPTKISLPAGEASTVRFEMQGYEASVQRVTPTGNDFRVGVALKPLGSSVHGAPP